MYIKNNGHISETFELSRGIRQGCPVSALLFIICTELLADKIIGCNKDLLGFNFGYPQNPLKINQYADDCILFLNNKNEMCVALSILEAYGAVSGLTLNMDKCEGFWLGKNKKSQKNCTLFGIKWPNQF